MAARAAQTPAGKVTKAVSGAAERQGAYDFLETGGVEAGALVEAQSVATMARAEDADFLFVSVDGSSIRLTDRSDSKGFGTLGAVSRRGHGLKVINALALTPEGVPVGLTAQSWWARKNAKSRTPTSKRQHTLSRSASEKETKHWFDAIAMSCASAERTNTPLWFVLDREADSQDMLRKLNSTGHRFTVRSSSNRCLESSADSLRERLAAEEPCGGYELKLTAGPKRKARKALMVVRHAPVVLRFRKTKYNKTLQHRMALTAVWTREETTTPLGNKPVDWLLLTNAPVNSYEDARQIVFSYTQRWRVEEFHKTWKTGACNIEDSQLRTPRAVMLWATILAAVAARIERLKALSRATPETSAAHELSQHEIKALLLLKRRQKKRTETVPNTTPTIRQATLWMAELGGYTGKSSGGPPGSITIRRGLHKVLVAADLLRALEAEQRSDQ